MSINEISDKYSKSQTSVFKTDLTDLLIAKLIPVKNKIDDLLKNRDFLKSQMLKGSERANNTASKKIQYINNIIGLGTNE
jgi:tryptophanyl-tRNA synthetase